MAAAVKKQSKAPQVSQSEQLAALVEVAATQTREQRAEAIRTGDAVLTGDKTGAARAAMAAVLAEIAQQGTAAAAADVLGVSPASISRWSSAAAIVEACDMGPVQAYSVASRTTKKARTAALAAAKATSEKATKAGQKSDPKRAQRDALAALLADQHEATKAKRAAQPPAPKVAKDAAPLPEHTPAPVSSKVEPAALLAGLTVEAQSETLPVDYPAMIRALSLALTLAEKIQPEQVTTSQVAAIEEAQQVADAIADRLAEITEKVAEIAA